MSAIFRKVRKILRLPGSKSERTTSTRGSFLAATSSAASLARILNLDITKRRGGEVEQLAPRKLYAVLESAISSQGSAELAFLFLIDHYEFDLDVLKDILQEMGLSLSFFNVTYVKIAPFVGLNPKAGLRDISTFQPRRARIPTSLFEDIAEDMQTMMRQYELLDDCQRVAARSRFLSPIFERTIAQFKLMIANIPELAAHDRVATQGRMKHHFVVLGLLTVVLIQVELGTAQEHLDAIAQVIAESDAGDYTNHHSGFGSHPICGVLCNGWSFEFFLFDGSTKRPTFSQGVFSRTSPLGATLHRCLELPSLQAHHFMLCLRPICESVFGFLLWGYQIGMFAHSQRSVSQGTFGETTLAWELAYILAKEAFDLAVEAAAEAEIGQFDSANATVEIAFSKLHESLDAVPPRYRPNDRDILSEEKVGRC